MGAHVRLGTNRGESRDSARAPRSRRHAEPKKSVSRLLTSPLAVARAVADGTISCAARRVASAGRIARVLW